MHLQKPWRNSMKPATWPRRRSDRFCWAHGHDRPAGRFLALPAPSRDGDRRRAFFLIFFESTHLIGGALEGRDAGHGRFGTIGRRWASASFFEVGHNLGIQEKKKVEDET